MTGTKKKKGTLKDGGYEWCAGESATSISTNWKKKLNCHKCATSRKFVDRDADIKSGGRKRRESYRKKPEKKKQKKTP